MRAMYLKGALLVGRYRRNHLGDLVLRQGRSQVVRQASPIGVLAPSGLRTRLCAMVLLGSLAGRVVSSLFRRNLHYFFKSRRSNERVPNCGANFSPSSSIVLFVISLYRGGTMRFTRGRLSTSAFFISP